MEIYWYSTHQSTGLWLQAHKQPLGKTTNLELIALDLFNSDLKPQKKWEETISTSPTQKVMPSNSTTHSNCWKEVSISMCRHSVVQRLRRSWSDWRKTNEYNCHTPTWCGSGNAGGGAEGQSGLKRLAGSSYQSNPTGIFQDAKRQGIKVKKLARASNLRLLLLASIGLRFSYHFVA